MGHFYYSTLLCCHRCETRDIICSAVALLNIVSRCLHLGGLMVHDFDLHAYVRESKAAWGHFAYVMFGKSPHLLFSVLSANV